MKNFFIKMANHYVHHSGILSTASHPIDGCTTCRMVFAIYTEHYNGGEDFT